MLVELLSPGISVYPEGTPNGAVSKTLNKLGINSVLEIVKKKHFNPELPQLHNFCVTALNNNYANDLVKILEFAGWRIN